MLKNVLNWLKKLIEERRQFVPGLFIEIRKIQTTRKGTSCIYKLKALKNHKIILTSQNFGILSISCRIPGISTIHDDIRPKRRNNEQTILVEVEFLQVGQALQHKPQAAVPQQQAKFAAQVAAEHTPKTAPMLGRNTIKIRSVLEERNI